MQKALNWMIALIGITLAVFVIVSVIRGYLYNLTWVGVTELRYQKSNQEEVQQAKTLWDWLNLLIIPIALAIGGYLFRQAEKRTDEEIAEKRRQQEQAIADERRQQEQATADNNLREAALQTYLDRTSELLLTQGLHTSDPSAEVRSVARARTLTTLNRLDPDRKATVLQFLYESKLINDPPIISLTGANLSEANLMRANLSEANLRGANLTRANLRGAMLAAANLTEATLAGADLTAADLRSTNFTAANLTQANLRGANLQGINLSGAELTGADFTSAYAIGTDLTRFGVTQEQLNQARRSYRPT